MTSRTDVSILDLKSADDVMSLLSWLFFQWQRVIVLHPSIELDHLLMYIISFVWLQLLVLHLYKMKCTWHLYLDFYTNLDYIDSNIN